MKDWKGNEIKVGDTVCVYQFEDMFAGGKMQACILTEDGIQNVGDPVEIKRHQYWELIQCIKVASPKNDKLIYAMLENGTIESPVEVPFDSLGFNIAYQSERAICIKGISDNELEHFLHFKNIPHENTNQEKSS